VTRATSSDPERPATEYTEDFEHKGDDDFNSQQYGFNKYAKPRLPDHEQEEARQQLEADKAKKEIEKDRPKGRPPGAELGEQFQR
jgi:hypothetical protein